MLTCKYCGKEIVEAVDAPSGYAHMNNYDYKMCCNFANVDTESTPTPNLEAIEIQYRCAAISGILANVNNEGMTVEHCLNEADEIVKAAIAKWHRS